MDSIDLRVRQFSCLQAHVRTASTTYPSSAKDQNMLHILRPMSKLPHGEPNYQNVASRRGLKTLFWCRVAAWSREPVCRAAVPGLVAARMAQIPAPNALPSRLPDRQNPLTCNDLKAELYTGCFFCKFFSMRAIDSCFWAS